MNAKTLQTKEELDIFVNPRRQSILRCMHIAGEPLTPKQISDRIGISPSSVQHHIGKLLSIGLIELSHTESIHGITARYYQLVSTTINVGLDTDDEHQNQRMAVMQNTLTQIVSGFTNYCIHKASHPKPEAQTGDMLYGILHLDPEKARELKALVQDFIQKHETKTPDSNAWEFTLIAYPVQEKKL